MRRWQLLPKVCDRLARAQYGTEMTVKVTRRSAEVLDKPAVGMKARNPNPVGTNMPSTTAYRQYTE